MTGQEKKIIITGAAGFIASCVVQYFNDNGFNNLILVDDFTKVNKTRNWQSKLYSKIVERDQLFDWLSGNSIEIECVIHLGARTDTTEFDYTVHDKLNVIYTKAVWDFCVKNDIPLIYASSAATYGNGEYGYDDNHNVVKDLQPLNPYGVSKNEFDKWALNQIEQPNAWAGLKFFNIYGPNESHKGRMASVIWHAFGQIKNTGQMKLFRSHNPKYKDGEQLRDFFYVKDLVKIIFWMYEQMTLKKWDQAKNGLYNLGTGEARSFYDLVKATFFGMSIPENIAFVDMPADIRDKYQYFTEANMQKLRQAGYTEKFIPLEEGVNDYVKNYLIPDKHY